MTRLGFSFLVGVPLLVLACSSSSTPPTGKACSVNSDCNNPLSCTFGRCHEACTVTRDCPTGQRCVKGALGNVCQLSDEKLCPVSGVMSTCQAPLACAVDLQCRNKCNSISDCVAGQSCASGACAEPTEVNTDGTLKVGTADGGVPASDGGMTATDAPVTVDSAPPGTLGPCGVPESEPNDMREQSTPIMAPVMLPSCIGTAMDEDFYELTAPAGDAGGGYYQFSITGVTDFTPDVKVFNVADQGEVGEVYANSDGQELHGYFSAVPGNKYRLRVTGFISVGKAPARYTLNVTYTKVDDAQEPNNTTDMAKMITLGTPVMGYMFGGIKALPEKDDTMQDWYAVTVPAGKFTVSVENVPANVMIQANIIDSTGKQANSGTPYAPNDGANATVMAEGPGGLYKIELVPFSLKGEYFFGKADDATTIPPNFNHPYKLTVTQP